MTALTLTDFKKAVNAYKDSNEKDPQTLGCLMSDYDDLSFKHDASQKELNTLADGIRFHESTADKMKY